MTHLCAVEVAICVDLSVLQPQVTPRGCQAAVGRDFLHELGHSSALAPSDSNSNSKRAETRRDAHFLLPRLLLSPSSVVAAWFCVEEQQEMTYSFLKGAAVYAQLLDL